MPNQLTKSVNALLEESLSMLNELRLLEEHWDMLDEELQTDMLIVLDRMERKTYLLTVASLEIRVVAEEIIDQTKGIVHKAQTKKRRKARKPKGDIQ